MKAILIDSPSRSVKEIEFDDSKPGALAELLGSDHVSSTFVRDHEIIIYLPDGQPEGFLMPLEKQTVHGRGKALILGSIGGRTVDTQLTAIHVNRGMFFVLDERVQKEQQA